MFLYKQGQITNYSKPYVAIGELATRTAPYRSRRDFFFPLVAKFFFAGSEFELCAGLGNWVIP